MLRTNAGITMLVNNAGVGALRPLLESDVDKMADMIELNVKALTRLTYAVALALSPAEAARSSICRLLFPALRVRATASCTVRAKRL